MLKMGYKPGKGLGNDGSGLVNPIDVKLRPAKMGLGHKGFDEKTETVKEEMRRQRERNGDEHGSSGEESTDGNVGGKNNKRNVWKQQDDAGGGQHQQQHQRKPAARKHTYKTAAQLIAEQEQQAETAAGTASTSSVPSTILDMTGEEVRILTSASQISTNSMQMVQHARLPELRHNLMLIMDMAQTELVSAAKSTALEKRRVEDNEVIYLREFIDTAFVSLEI